MRRAQPDAPAAARLQRAFLGDLVGIVPRSDAERQAALRRPPRGTVSDRWHVYAHGYIARIVEALELEFAAVRRILGPEAFGALVGRYLAVFPPRSFDLANAGDRLARFLEFDALTTDLPFLPDLARLERSVAEAFTAADAEPISAGLLRQLRSEDASTLRMSLSPGVALWRSPWPLLDLWRSRLEAQDEAVSIPLEGRPERVLVFRREHRVRVERVSESEAELVEASGSGDVTPFDLLELAGAAEHPELLAELASAFRDLVERGIFVHKRSTGWTGALEIPMEESR